MHLRYRRNSDVWRGQEAGRKHSCILGGLGLRVERQKVKDAGKGWARNSKWEGTQSLTIEWHGLASVPRTKR